MWLLRMLLAVPLSCGAAQRDTGPQLDMRPRKLDCSRLDRMTKGRPVFVDSREGVRLGISTQKDVVAFGEPVAVDISYRTQMPN
jgi:hypothetical protein